MQLKRFAAPFFVATGVFIACTSDEPATDGPGTKSVGPAGGVIELGSVTLDIPAGALDAEQRIAIRETTDAPPPDTDALAKVYAFEPDGLLFKKPIRARFATADTIDGEVFWTNPDTSSLEPVASTVEPGAVVASTTHFSRGCAVKHRCRPEAACTLGPTCKRVLTTCQPGRDQEISRECTCVSGRYECTNAKRACTGTDAGVDASDGSADAGCLGLDLTSDPKNCGACGHDCNGGACASGLCQAVVLATDQISPYDIVSNGVDVYWGNLTEGGAVMKCSVNGCSGTPTVVAADAPAGPRGITLDDTSVYWLQSGDIKACPLAGCGGATPRLLGSTGSRIGIVADGTSVFWTQSDAPSGSAFGTARAGGGPVEMYATAPSSPGWLTADGDSLYWSGWASDSRGVWKVRKDKTGSTQLYASPGTAHVPRVAVDASYIYFTEADNHSSTSTGSVYRANKDGSGRITLVTGIPAPNGIATDGKHVYWTMTLGVNFPGQPLIARCAVGGCAGVPTIMYSGPDSAFQLAVDAKNIYWTNNRQPAEGFVGAVRKLAK